MFDGILIGISDMFHTWTQHHPTLIHVLGFFWTNYDFNASSPLAAMTMVLSRRLPGSYTDRQLVTLMGVFFAGYYYQERKLNGILEDLNYLQVEVIHNI